MFSHQQQQQNAIFCAAFILRNVFPQAIKKGLAQILSISTHIRISTKEEIRPQVFYIKTKNTTGSQGVLQLI